jgi:hypothetical protein
MKYAEKVLQMGGDIRCGHRVIQAKRSVSGASVYSPTCSRDGVLLDDSYVVEHGRVIHVCNAPRLAVTASLAIGANITDRYIGMAK